MTDQKRNFLQETAFEEDINFDSSSDNLKNDKSKKKVADKYSQWLQSDKR